MSRLDRLPVPNRAIRNHIAEYGIQRGVKIWGTKWYLRKTRSIEPVNFFDKEWDVLIVLDACRLDLMQEVAPEYTYVSSISSVTSVGSATHQWMPETIDNTPIGVLKGTAFITGNPFSDKFLNDDQFAVLDEVWRYAWDEDAGTVLPRPVTDRAISVGREVEPERLVVHYMQPHAPFVNSAESQGFNLETFTSGPEFRTEWQRLANDERTFDEVWSDYKDNLRLVMDDLELLLQSINADKVVITSDHGNAMGEYGLYGHPGDVPISCLHDVPWCVTGATDNGAYCPEEYSRSNNSDELTEKLDALGYR